MHYKGRVKLVISYNFTCSLLGDVTVYSVVHRYQRFRVVCYLWFHYYPLHQEWKTNGTSTKSTRVILAGISDMCKSLQLNSTFHSEFYWTKIGIRRVVILWINIFMCIIIHNNEIHTYIISEDLPYRCHPQNKCDQAKNWKGIQNTQQWLPD